MFWALPTVRSALFTCCRDGEYKGRVQSTGQNRTRRASRKMGTERFCLAHIVATEDSVSGKVSVKYTPTHTNHEVTLKECKNLPLPKEVGEQVKRLFSTGVTKEKIMDGECTFHTVAQSLLMQTSLLQLFEVIWVVVYTESVFMQLQAVSTSSHGKIAEILCGS